MESSDPVVITKLRDMLVTEMTAYVAKYDASDLERVKTNNWTIERFLSASQMNLDQAFTMAKEAMEWRKRFGVNSRTDLSFPKEFYKVGAMFPYCEDKEGRPVIYIRIKLYKNLSAHFVVNIQRFLIHITNKIDIQTQEKGFAMVWDLTGAGPSNWDLTMVQYIISSIRSYFPGGLKYLIPFGFNWIMSTFVKIGVSLLSAESKKKIKIITRDELFNFIEPNKVPDFLSGLSIVSYKVVPEGARKLREMAGELGFTGEEVEQFFKFYEHELQYN